MPQFYPIARQFAILRAIGIGNLLFCIAQGSVGKKCKCEWPGYGS